MSIFIRFILRLLPDAFVEEVNAVSLDELDARGLIIWAEDVEEWRDELSI
ncbi:MAG: hypothetical protein ACYTXC_23670 [Nostoc sp.]|jgi:hypothetical protein